jgi:hypothetical protein
VPRSLGLVCIAGGGGGRALPVGRAKASIQLDVGCGVVRHETSDKASREHCLADCCFSAVREVVFSTWWGTNPITAGCRLSLAAIKHRSVVISKKCYDRV